MRICLLGEFRVLKHGQTVTFRSGGKAEVVLSTLALRRGKGLARTALLDAVWPDTERQLAAQSLNTLVYSLHRQLGDALGGATPSVHEDHFYRLNSEAGVSVDVDELLSLADEGDGLARAGDEAAAGERYARAVELYSGDLTGGTSVHDVIERERVRALCIRVLWNLVQYEYSRERFSASLELAHRLLSTDPCREDAHRLIMHCYLRTGERAQALRQYRVCETVLREEFDALPEAATRTLFNQVRVDPSRVLLQ